MPVSRTGIPLPFARCIRVQYPVSGIRYPVPGIAIELVQTGPGWPRKVRLTLPKGLGPLLKEVIFDRFWAGSCWTPSWSQNPQKTWAKMGQNGRNRLKTGQTGPKWPKQVRSTLPTGRGPRLKFSILTVFGPIWPGCRLAVDSGWQLLDGDWWLTAVGDCRLALDPEAVM